MSPILTDSVASVTLSYGDIVFARWEAGRTNQ